MIRNYLKIAWRNIFRQKLFSLINIVGLAVALGAFFLIIQYAGFERSYDRFHEKAEQIYRVNSTREENDRIVYRTAFSAPNAGPFLAAQFDEVNTYTRVFSLRSNFVCAVSYTDDTGTISFNERNAYYGDENFFNVFSYPLLTGDKASILIEPFTALISQSAARRYFGDEDPVGRVVRLINSSEEHDYRITGVLADMDNESHLEIDFLFSYSSLMNSAFRAVSFDNWDADGLYTYVLARRKIDTRLLNERLQAELRAGKDDPGLRLDLQPVTDIHLSGGLQDEPTPTRSKTIVDLLLLVACFVVALAWVNYSNLAIADALRRAREVGLRKIIGANAAQIVIQFAVQFMLINCLAVVLACALVPLMTPVLQELTGARVAFRWTGLPLLPLFTFFVLGMLASGGYPAYVLSRLSPGNSIRGTYFSGPQKSLTRQVLVGFQFCVSIALVTGTLIIQKQMDFMQDADLGMNIGNTVVVRAPVFGDSTSGFRLQTFSEVLLAQPTVDEVLLSVTTPDGGENGWVAGIRRKQEDKITKSAVINVIDRNFFKVFGIGLVAGRDFLPSEYRAWEKFGEQTESVVINVSTVGLLGFDSPETAIDQTFFWGEDRCRVVGVVRDFHQRSLQFEVEPAVFLLDRNGTNFCIRISETITPSDIPAVLTALENAYRQFFPHDPFEYFFLEDRFDLQYHEDRRFSALFSFFSILALFIAWLGLAGLVTFFLLHRRKEIGIRKVLGATVASILGMVSKNYVRLGLISVVIITPFTYYFINRWLEQYAYHISPDWWMFGWPALMVLLSAIIVVICQAMKSALTNPAESLRNE